MAVNYGSKRLVVGAGYGVRDWLVQRVTGGLMALFTVIVLAQVLVGSGPIGYDKWAGIFSAQWMKVLTFTVIASLLWHVWVGMRDVWMDYVQPVGLRPRCCPMMSVHSRTTRSSSCSQKGVWISAVVRP